MLLLQMVYPNGDICRFPAGGPIEEDLIKLITNHIMPNYSRFKSRAQIETIFQKAIEEAIYEFKTHSIQVIKGPR